MIFPLYLYTSAVFHKTLSHHIHTVTTFTSKPPCLSSAAIVCFLYGEKVKGLVITRMKIFPPQYKRRHTFMLNAALICDITSKYSKPL